MAYQSSRTPYDHLRFMYPETWKNLVKMMEKGASATTLPEAPASPDGHVLEGGHQYYDPGSPTQSQRKKALEKMKRDYVASKTPGDLAKDEEMKIVMHQLKMLKNTKRNPFGGWYEGMQTTHKISCDYAEKQQ